MSKRVIKILEHIPSLWIDLKSVNNLLKPLSCSPCHGRCLLTYIKWIYVIDAISRLPILL